MKLHFSELENGIRLITLDGKLDSHGVDNVEFEFIHHCAGDTPRVLVDLSRVSYISSIGIPMLVNAARSVAARGGEMALLNPHHTVMDVLDLVGVSRIIPVYYDLGSARAGLSS
ncbi:MAG: STAS domain-containing protein [Anaerolineales bacterium]|nr:STAS domain-containing protein [Anaerolineales bacterium]